MADAPTIERASLAELFDRHASLVIDDSTYRVNPTLRDLADRVFALVGLTSNDVSKDGVTIYRSYAVIHAFELDADGNRVLRNWNNVRRVVTVPLDGESI